MTASTSPLPHNPPPPDLKTFLIAISSVVIVWLPVLLLHLTLVMFSALITFAATRGIADWLRRHIVTYLAPAAQRKLDQYAEAIALLFLFSLILLCVSIFGDWVADKASVERFNNLLTQILQISDQLHQLLPESISKHLPASVSSFQSFMMSTVKSHVPQIQLVGIHTLRGFGYVLAGTIIGAIGSLQIPRHIAANSKPLVVHFHQKFDELMAGFSDVFFAQAKISSINTILTSVYLLGILPLVGHPLPMAWTVVLITFCAGLFPVVGNLISNIIIVLLSLTHGLGVSAMSLLWLVGIHKLEYFLNAQIIGTKIHAAAWELLIFMLLLESMFGLSGLISAPIIYAQIKRILSQRHWI